MTKQTCPRGGLSEQGGDPRTLDVVGSPLSRQAAGRSREPVVVERAIRRAEWADRVPAEEVALLVDVGAGVDVRMRTDGVVPPGRARLLGTDANEVRRSRHLVALRLGAGWDRSRPPMARTCRTREGSIARTAMRQFGEGGDGDPAHAVPGPTVVDHLVVASSPRSRVLGMVPTRCVAGVDHHSKVPVRPGAAGASSRHVRHGQRLHAFDRRPAGRTRRGPARALRSSRIDTARNCAGATTDGRSGRVSPRGAFPIAAEPAEGVRAAFGRGRTGAGRHSPGHRRGLTEAGRRSNPSSGEGRRRRTRRPIGPRGAACSGGPVDAARWPHDRCGPRMQRNPRSRTADV